MESAKPNDQQRTASSANQKPKQKNDKQGSTVGGIIVLVIIVGLVVWGVSVLTGGGSKKPTNNTQNTANTTTTSSTDNSAGAKIKQWSDTNGWVFTTLGNDLSTFSKDAQSGDTTASGTDCQQLQDDVTAAQHLPAIPDATSEQHWSSALSYLQSSASDCIQGIQNNDVNQITQANNEMTQATNELNATSSAIKQASGQQ